MQKAFIAIVAGILLLALFLYFKPVFSVNGQMVWSPEFKANVSAAENADKKFAEKNPGLPLGADLELASAEHILEARLVHKELQARLDSKTLESVLDNKMNTALENPNFMSEAQDLYGLDSSQIKNYIIIPQAEEDILKSKLLLQGQDFGDWLSAAKKSAQVKTYFASFKWNGSGFVK